MSIIKEAGTYLAKPIAWGLETPDGKLPRFVVQFSASAVKASDGWQACDDQQITGYFNLIKSDGGLNEINARSLKESLGWDGATFGSLEDGDWSGVEVQLVVEPNTYNGKTTMQVRYLNSKNYAGNTVQKADAIAVKGLDAKYGSTLRALFGTKAGAAKPKPTASPAPSVKPADSAKAAAWNALTEKTPSYDRDRRTETFRKIAKDLFPVKEPREFTPEEWDQVREAVVNDFSEATGELIPY